MPVENWCTFIFGDNVARGANIVVLNNEFPPILDCWYLTGATASGKTRIGIQLAEAINAEIISLDSIAFYRGMNIGTAKPSDAEQSRVRHHLLNVVEPNQEFNLAEYLTRAHAAVQESYARNKAVLFVGGTHGDTSTYPNGARR